MKNLTFRVLTLMHDQVHFQSAPCSVLEVGTRVQIDIQYSKCGLTSTLNK